MDDTEIEDILFQQFNKEIVRELLVKDEILVDDALVDKVWALNKESAWDAHMIYTLSEAVSKMNTTTT